MGEWTPEKRRRLGRFNPSRSKGASRRLQPGAPLAEAKDGLLNTVAQHRRKRPSRPSV